MKRIRYGLDYLLLFLILCLSTSLLIGDFDVRLANTSSDEGLIAAAYIYKYPDNFRNDPYSRNWVFYALASMMSWLPALLFKHMNVSPEIPALLFVYLQNVLLGFAVFRFSLMATGRRDVAWLSTVFTFCYRPYCWNLAGYGDLMWMPYAGHLALPFLIYAATFAVENILSKTIILLMIGGLFHPALGIMTAIIIGGYWFKQHFKNPENHLYYKLFLLILAVGISILPSQISLANVERVIDSRFISQFFGNSHAAPWEKNNLEYYYNFVNNFIIITICCGFVALSLRNAGLNGKVRSFWITAFTASVVLCLSHVMAYYFQVVSIFQLILTRSTLLVVIFSVPLIILPLVDWFNAGGFMNRLVVVFYFLHGPSLPVMLSAFIGTLSAGDLDFVVTRHREKYRVVIRYLGYSIFVSILLINIFPWEFTGIKKIVIPYVEYNTSLKYSTNLIIIVLSFIIATFGSNRTSSWISNSVNSLSASVREIFLKLVNLYSPASGDGKRFASVLLLVTMLLIIRLLIGNYLVGRQATTGEFRAYYEVQLWARNNTNPDSVFIIADSPIWFGWRNFSHRPFLFPNVFIPYYFLTEDINSYNRNVLAFYSCHYGRTVDFDEKVELFRGLDTAGMLKFSQRFKGEYLVRKTVQNGSLQLPVAYKNNYYTVFEL